MLSFLRNKNLNLTLCCNSSHAFKERREPLCRDEKEMEGGSNPRMTGGV